ncbi:hypothetical protein GCM10022207_76380 [Streptomyces lannensis]|uniref:Uncharacterized protein n=1 Tax=Streptomyces lannensis TaxID=766498 RepID=A0ABP7LC69_9ACTN
MRDGVRVPAAGEASGGGARLTGARGRDTVASPPIRPAAGTRTACGTRARFGEVPSGAPESGHGRRCRTPVVRGGFRARRGVHGTADVVRFRLNRGCVSIRIL